MRRFGRVHLVAAGVAGVLVGGISFGPGASAAGPNPALAVGSHAFLSNGKPLPHVSGGTEAAFNEERALAADAQAANDSGAGPANGPTALGCGSSRSGATNVRINQDCTARRQAEEQVRSNPFDSSNIVAGTNDSRIGFNHCGFEYTVNGGANWGDGIPPFFQNLGLLGRTYDAASDPALTFDGSSDASGNRGRAWYSCVLFDINDNQSALAVTPSTPLLKGSAYRNTPTGSPFIVTQDATGHHFFDKEFIAGDPNGSAVYVTFTDFQSEEFCKAHHNTGGFCQSPIFISKWNGISWTTPVEISGASGNCVGGNTFSTHFAANACNFDQGSFPMVESDGTVYVAWNNGNTPSLVNQQLGRHLSVADDGTVTFLSSVEKVGVDDESNVALCDFGRGPEECVRSVSWRADDFPALYIDPNDSMHLVTTWTDSRTSTASSPGHYDIVVSESRDGGASWSDASGGGTVLTPAGGAAYNQPSITATQSRVAVSAYQANPYPDSAPAGGGTFSYGTFSSSKASLAFSPYTQQSDCSACPSPQNNPAQAGFNGDYSSIDRVPGSDQVVIVWSDTRNGSGSDSSFVPDEDVFFKRVSV